MKKVWKLILIVLLIAVVVAAALAWQYRDYLYAFLDSRRYSAEELQVRMEDNEATLADIAAKYLPQQTDDDTDNDDNAEKEIESTSEENLANLVGSQPAESTAQIPAGQNNLPNEEMPDPEVSAIVLSFYALRDSLMEKLDALKNSAYQEYHALPETERTDEAFLKLARKYLRQVTLLEIECDEEVLSLMTKLQATIDKNGGDPSLPDQIYEAYLNEKSLKKAWYISELEKRGLILS